MNQEEIEKEVNARCQVGKLYRVTMLLAACKSFAYGRGDGNNSYLRVGDVILITKFQLDSHILAICVIWKDQVGWLQCPLSALGYLCRWYEPLHEPR